MQSKKINPIIRWWMTPKLPPEDIFELPLLKDKRPLKVLKFRYKQWIVHPIRRRRAKIYLFLLQKFTDIKVIGVTGSAGKTTTTEMIASILKQKGETVAGDVGIDPVYNIPNTILRAKPTTKYLILEMGVEFPGEMDYYLWLAKPDIGVITNIFPTHTEYFRDLDGVFKEKSKLVKSLPKGAIAVLNAENRYLLGLKDKLSSNIKWFGDKLGIDAGSQRLTSDFKTEFLIKFPNDKKPLKVLLNTLGDQYVQNALAATAVAKSFGFSDEAIHAGLSSFSMAPHRMIPIKHKSGAMLFDDTYNNNPEAAKETIKTFSIISKHHKRLIIFGDMLDLGTLQFKFHEELGEFLSKKEFCPDDLICIGKNSAITAKVAAKTLGNDHVFTYQNYKDATPQARKMLKKGRFILVKGSRSIRLDLLVSELQAS